MPATVNVFRLPSNGRIGGLHVGQSAYTLASSMVILKSGNAYLEQSCPVSDNLAPGQQRIKVTRTDSGYTVDVTLCPTTIWFLSDNFGPSLLPIECMIGIPRVERN